MPHTGSCLCGACTITVKSTRTSSVLCHCLDCQHVSGGPFVPAFKAWAEDVTIEGDVREYKLEANGQSGARVFCGTCGSPLAQKSTGFKGHIAIYTGNLPDFRTKPITEEIFVKDRWTALKAIDGAVQTEAMAESS